MLDGDYIPKGVKVLEIKEMAPDIYFMRLDARIKSTPGQFIQLSILGYGEAPFSIASHSMKHIDLCIKCVGDLTSKIKNVEKGDVVYIRGPYGNGYPVSLFEGKDVVIVAGGTGITPLRALIEYIEKRRSKFEDMYIYLGFRSPDHIIFRDDIERWKRKFKVVVTVDKVPEDYKGEYDGEESYLAPIIEKYPVDARNKVAVVCGPPIMMRTVVQALRKLKFEGNQIYLSLERRMECGKGQCGHCMINHKYVCKDGPVFRYDELGELDEAGI